MILSNKPRAKGELISKLYLFVIAAVLIIPSISAAAQDSSRQAVKQSINAVLQSMRGPNEPQGGRKAKSAAAPRFSKSEDGYLLSLGAPPAYYFPVTSAIRGNAQATAKNFLKEHNVAFGITSSKVNFITKKTKIRGGRSNIRFQQTYADIPVFGAEVIIQLNDANGIEYVLSDIMRDTKSLDTGELKIKPTVTREKARQTAVKIMAKENPNLELAAEEPNLMIYHPAAVGNTGKTRLVWQTTVTSVSKPFVAEFVLVDAHTAEIALRYSLIMNTKYRQVYDAANTTADPGTLCREEGWPPSGLADCDDAYDYLGDTYDFYYNFHGRDSINDAGMTLSTTVRFCDFFECPMINAFWYNNRMYFGEDMATDDITGHELTHGVTEYESNLIYQGESGAINESFSDMWGEWIDQTNGKGNDSPTVKWKLGEDCIVGAVRDMKDPAAYDQPDRKCSPLWQPVDDPYDNGGVHTNSGVGNKLCYLLTDGDTFNGHTITGMGIEKVAELFYEVQTSLLPSGADYADLHSALTQAANVLGWTEAEKQNLEEACQAVELSNDCQGGCTEPVDDCSTTDYFEYSSTDVPKTITDFTTIYSTIVVFGTGSISDINVKLNITHTWDSDLEVFLVAPDGTRVELFTDVGGYGENFSNTILNDEATTSITSGSAPFACSYRPEGSLSALDGKSITGTWTLEVTDHMGGDTGTLNSWSLFICHGNYCGASGGCEEYIRDVAVGTINNTGTGCSHYDDYTGMATIMQIGQSYYTTVTNGNPYDFGDLCGIWVDWNQNRDFLDPGETITVTDTDLTGKGQGPYVAEIIPPQGAMLGDTRMRVRIGWFSVAPCGNASYGEVEDYTVTVTSMETVKISGYAKTYADTALEGVTVTASTGENDTTDSSGYYELTLTKPWSGTITAGKSGWTFEPPDREYTDVSADITNENYTATPDEISVQLELSRLWMYQNLPGQTNSCITAEVNEFTFDDPAGNSAYTFYWEFELPGDVTVPPVSSSGGGEGDTSWTFCSQGCNELSGISDSGQTLKVRLTIVGNDYGNFGVAEREFAIRLLGDVNNDTAVGISDRQIINAFWRTGSAGPYTLKDCDINCDGNVNIIDRQLANAIWRGLTCSNSIGSPCPLP